MVATLFRFRMKKLNLMNKTLLILARWFSYAFFAVLPFQIKTFLFVPDVFVSGFSNPYMGYFLYIGDLFLLLALLFFSLTLFFGKKKKKRSVPKIYYYFFFAVLAFLIFSVLSVFISQNFENSIFHLFRLLEFFFLYLILVFGGLKNKTLFNVLIASVFLNAILGIFQYFFQQSLGLGVLGESLLSSDMKSVAKVALSGGDLLRAYGTFPHPNLFAAYLVFAILLVLNGLKESKILFSVFLGICLLGLLLTFSRSAFLALIIGLAVYFLLSADRKIFKYLLWAVFFVLILGVFLGFSSVLQDRIFLGDFAGFSERLFYFDISREMFFTNPFGIGLGNFTLEMQNYADLKIVPWFFQPVHNLFLLVLNEMGIQGFLSLILIFVFGFWGLWKRSPLVFSLLLVVFVLGNFDHYFFTLYQGQALLWIVFGLTGRELIGSR